MRRPTPLHVWSRWTDRLSALRTAWPGCSPVVHIAARCPQQTGCPGAPRLPHGLMVLSTTREGPPMSAERAVPATAPTPPPTPSQSPSPTPRPMRSSHAGTASNEDDAEHRNEVHLRGRLSGSVEIREVPSGDRVAVWRIVIPRPVRRGQRAGVDTIDCESFRPAIIRRAEHWPDGSSIELDGALRRRFWQTPGGPRSRYVVDVQSARKA